MDFGVLTRHDRHNNFCKFPRMKCMCDGRNKYERLSSESSSLEEVRYSRLLEDANTNEKQETMRFFNRDGSYQSVLVEKSLCAVDLCQLLAMKNRVPKDTSWCIMEHWADMGLERFLEDHEYVLSASRDMKGFAPHSHIEFHFEKEFRKYEFFKDPNQFFPAGMVDYYVPEVNVDQPSTSAAAAAAPDECLVVKNGLCTMVFSQVWIRDEAKKIWSKFNLLLHHKQIFCSTKIHAIHKLLKTIKEKKGKITEADYGGVSVYVSDISKFHIYTSINAKNYLRAPTGWALCLRLYGVDTEDENPDIRCIALDSETSRSCWLTAMRLAKYGKQLRENYRAFKNKQGDTINPKDYNSYTVPHESVRSRVAMDFTGNVGRIVEDPKEAKAIALAEGYSWKRRWRPSARSQVATQGIDSGIHITQPWFHSGMSRDQASALVSKHGTVDGVFIVRDSKSHPGTFVLTYKCKGKVMHTQIQRIQDKSDEDDDTYYYTLDGGTTKFYDLLQLVEFYQLNAGFLSTKLSHYVVENTINLPSTPKVTTPPKEKKKDKMKAKSKERDGEKAISEEKEIEAEVLIESSSEGSESPGKDA